jgi:hypothetical protein
MIALPYDYFLIGWFILAVASTAYVAIDTGLFESAIISVPFLLPSKL